MVIPLTKTLNISFTMNFELTESFGCTMYISATVALYLKVLSLILEWQLLGFLSKFLASLVGIIFLYVVRCTSSYFVYILRRFRWFSSPHPYLRQWIGEFAVVAGWLLIEIGWFVLFLGRKTSIPTIVRVYFEFQCHIWCVTSVPIVFCIHSIFISFMHKCERFRRDRTGLSEQYVCKAVQMWNWYANILYRICCYSARNGA